MSEMTNTTTDEYGFQVIASGEDEGRFATAEVAVEAYVQELCSVISDISKDARGYRHRFDASAMTLDDLKNELDYWVAELEETELFEDAEREFCVKKFKSLVQTCIDHGAKDETTALRWIVDSEDFQTDQDVEHFVYKHGILFTEYGKQVLEKLFTVVTYKTAEV